MQCSACNHATAMLELRQIVDVEKAYEESWKGLELGGHFGHIGVPLGKVINIFSFCPRA
jgi:hypothetical protein